MFKDGRGMGRVSRNSKKRGKPVDPLKGMSPLERKAEQARRKKEDEDRKKTLKQIREQHEKNSTISGNKQSNRRSLKKHKRSLEKHKPFRKRAEELGITLTEYKIKFSEALTNEQKTLLDLAILRETRRAAHWNKRELSQQSYASRDVDKSPESNRSSSEYKAKLTGAALLRKYREIIGGGGTEIKASIECGWDYKTELGWFKQAVEKAKKDELGQYFPKETQIKIDSNGREENQTDGREGEDSGNSEAELIRKTRISRHTKKIRGGNFRRDVLKAHSATCACCDISIQLLIEAAHIRPVEKDGSDSFKNGIPLCPTHHAAFDGLLFTIDPIDKQFIPANGYSLKSLGIVKTNVLLKLSFDALVYRRVMFEERGD
jgi:hypothetical protein